MTVRKTIALTLADAAFHRDNFSLFCELELDAGGPDSHMEIIGYTMGDLPAAERIWRAGCSIAPYSVGAAAAIWREWNIRRVLTEGGKLDDWVREHWRGLPIRRERRAVKSVPKLARCLREYARWAARGMARFASYDEAWESVRDEVTFFGRYATIKLLETLHRYCGLEPALGDIRPRGAWSPRLTLSYMYPEFDRELNGKSDSPEVLGFVNRLATDTFYRVRERVGDRLTYFKLEVLLCNYRQALERKYPGRVHDSELGLFKQAEVYWGADRLRRAVDFYGARAALFPRRCLGELRGWVGARDELNYGDLGYMWSDVLYDFCATKQRGDFTQPVRWEDGP
jgi:hypothetical protein